MEDTMDEAKQRVVENFDELRQELGERVQEIRETVSNYVDAHPIASIGIAFGVGYLLSGALFSRTTFKAASIGGRFALGGFLKQLVVGLGPGILAGAMSSARSGASGNGNKPQQQH
jgi:hypothetical protein